MQSAICEWSPHIDESQIKQHEAFLGGLENLHEYIKAFRAGKIEYDGNHIVYLIDSFGPTLRQHLADEITTLLELRKYGSDRMRKLYTELVIEGRKITVRWDQCIEASG